jgi:HlyD family secretion protein
MKKVIKYILAILIAVIFIGTFVFLFSNSRPKIDSYEEETVRLDTIERMAVVTGKITPRDEVNIKPQISGIISDIYMEAGQTVKVNDVIAKVRVIPDMSALSSAENRLRLAKINENQAQTNYDREKALYDKQLVSADEYDQIRQALDQAKEETRAAQENLEITRDGVSSSNASTSTTLIRSTIDGLILDVPVKIGTTVTLSNAFNDGTTIATVADMNDLIFDGNVDETEVGKLAEGMSVEITIGALQGVVLEARLEYISPKATVNNGANQFEIKAAVTPQEGITIRSGYSANARIVIDKAENVLAVPESTVEFEGENAFVYKKNGEEFERTPIDVGLSDGVMIEVKSGLKEGDIVRGNKIIENDKTAGNE